MAIDWKEHDRIKRPYKPSDSESKLNDLVMKPCPFCGNKDLEMWDCSKDNVPNHVYCSNCLVDGPRRDNKKEAIEAWNERAL
jgi:Lar family restriction alleviation protein